jgi:hypothetical protein
MKHKFLAALVAAAIATACTHAVDASGAPSFGQAAETNLSRQINPGATDPASPEGSGSQGALAQSRYRTGTTKPLLPSNSSVANPSTTN